MEKLLLLHGALGCQSQFNNLKAALSEFYEVYTLDLYGHGSAAFSSEPFKIRLFSEQVFNWLKTKKLASVSIFGYSMGGYVALHLAASHPEKVKRIYTLATKFDWNEISAEKETKLLDPEKIEAKVPLFARELSERHGTHHWKNVLHKTAEMMQDLGREKALSDAALAQIDIPVLVSVGDRDPMVSLEETVAVSKKLKNAALLVLPNTVHPLEKIPLARLVFECRQFFG